MRLTVWVFPVLCLIVGGCSFWYASSRPAWVMGDQAKYPPSRYLLGMGEGESFAQAEERAYAAVAKIFQAEVEAHSRDWESFWLQETTNGKENRREVELEMLTKVTTKRVLADVQVFERWHNEAERFYMVLAGMDRQQAEQATLDRIAEYDRIIQQNVEQARIADNKLQHLFHLKQAIKTLVLREASNADLRVIRETGKGVPSPYQGKLLLQELRQFLGNQFLVRVEVIGENSDSLKVALVEGLTKQGFRVIGDPRSRKPVEDVTTTHENQGNQVPDVLIKGEGMLWKLDFSDPLFFYVRWCEEFRIMEAKTQRVIGISSQSGREGHITEKAALARGLASMEQSLTSDIATILTNYIYGDETENPQGTGSACHPSSH